MFQNLLKLFKKDKSEEDATSAEKLVDINEDPIQNSGDQKESMFDYVIDKENQQQKEKEDIAFENPKEPEDVLPDPDDLGEAIPKTQELVDDEMAAEDNIEEDTIDNTVPNESISDNSSEDALSSLIDSDVDVIIKKDKDSKIISSETTVIQDSNPLNEALENEDAGDDLLLEYETQETEDKLDPAAEKVDRSASIIKSNSILSILDKEIMKSVAKEYDKVQSSVAPKAEEAFNDNDVDHDEVEESSLEERITYTRAKKGSRVIRPD